MQYLLSEFGIGNPSWQPTHLLSPHFLLCGLVTTALACFPNEVQSQSRTDDLVVSIEDADALEGRPLEFRISVSEERDVALRVDWELTPETAINGVDFRSNRRGTLQIPAGATEGFIRIKTVSDQVAEPDDHFKIALLDVDPIPPDGALLAEGASTATGTIIDDDGGLVIPDDRLEWYIRYALDKPYDEPLTADDLASLTELHPGGEDLIDLTGIEFAHNLTQFGLGFSSVVDISPLAHLPKLSWLIVTNGILRDLSPLGTMTNLSVLHLDKNEIADVEPLRGLTRLQTLDVSGNSVSNIEPLMGLTGLEFLTLDDNVIGDIGPLGALIGLRSLSLSDNLISSLAPLQELVGLTNLWLSDNSIRDLAPIANLTRLIFLDAGRNDISNLEPLLTNGDFASGNLIYLHDNPLDRDAREVQVPALRQNGAVVGTVSVSVMDASAPEGGPLRFKVHLSEPVDEPVDLIWTVDERTWSTANVDYATPTEQYSELTIPAGVTKADFTVTTLRDNADEVHEPVLVRVLEPYTVGLSEDHRGLPTGVTMRLPLSSLEAFGLILDPRPPSTELPYVGSADQERRQGVVRVINHYRRNPTAVRIEAIDDFGDNREPITLSIGSGEARQFTSRDLEEGNLIKGLSDGVAAGTGDWRLQLQSNDITAIAFVRTADGLLTSMQDLVPLTSVGYSVPIFNPGRNTNQVSWLRLTNTNDQTANVRIRGIDDSGFSPGSEVSFRVAPGQSRLFSASALESGSGSGVDGALGIGTGKWRLIVASNVRIRVMNLLESPTGHLSNLSTLATRIESEDESNASFRIPLFPSAMDSSGREGFVRVVNWSDESATVRISARDDTDWKYEPVILTLEANTAVQLNSHDLESGNSKKGLLAGIGAGEGDWRLELATSQDIDVGGYIRTQDGFLTSMHDVIAIESGSYFVPTFNPGRNRAQVSSLRLINNETRRAEVRIRAVDDRGRTPGEEVLLYVGGQSARTIPSRVLEEGRWGLVGGIGTGYGKWRLTVSADVPIEVLSLMESPTGHLVNLSP